MPRMLMKEMNDAQLRSLFSTLATLAQQGPIPVQAYSVLVGETCPAALSEQMHQRWLADARFGPIAANIIQHIFTADPNDLGVSSNCLALLLNDFRSRLDIRHQSGLMFRNSCRALFAMYPVYRQIDSCVSQCFVKPMFRCLEMLIEAEPEKHDIETVADLIIENGYTLNELNAHLLDKLVVKCRRRLVSDDVNVDAGIRVKLLHIFDLWAFGWREWSIPETLLIDLSMEEQVEEELHLHRKKDKEEKSFGSKESIV